MSTTPANKSENFAVACVTACFLLLSLAACDDQQPDAAAPPPPPDVTVAAVTEGAVPIVMEFSGTVQAVKSVDIIPRVSGYIEKRYFVEGADLKEGDPLYLIDPRPFKATLDEYTAQLDLDQANSEFWKNEVKRYGDAVKSGAVSQEQYNEALTREDEARAEVDKTKADIDNAKLDLSFTKILAPFDGRVQETRLYEGDLASEYEDTLTTLVQMDPIHVIFNVTRRQLYQIQEMQHQGLVPRAKEHAAVELSLPNGDVYPHQGKLDFVSARIDPTTDSLTMRALVRNDFEHGDEGDLVAGQYVPVRLILGTDPKTLLIPQAALIETQAGKQVLVVGADDKVESRTVVVTSSYQGHWVITDGLKAGEQVIVEGLQKARPGMVVAPKPMSAKQT